MPKNNKYAQELGEHLVLVKKYLMTLHKKRTRILHFRLLEESMRWLISNGKVAEAKKVLKKTSKLNKIEYDATEQLLNECINFQTTEPEMSDGSKTYPQGQKQNCVSETMKPQLKKHLRKKAVEKYNVIDILRNPGLRVNTIILWYSW